MIYLFTSAEQYSVTTTEDFTDNQPLVYGLCVAASEASAEQQLVAMTRLPKC